ncbi:peptidase inhibitor family I36 protein [Nonomuraea guangzhouensis]|uniref:Peptidase inhibitor family I36 protein n=1 Tax=Nonomuraea guangzhouensis TaxID=1291555 RepID=A0ABW4GMW3_9ACTN|nr:peptidase inhibitor family I36 protein [Nonomuraea guangzhouensis]
MRRAVIGMLLAFCTLALFSLPAKAEPEPSYFEKYKVSTTFQKPLISGTMEDGVCNWYDLCVFENQNLTGRMADFTYMDTTGHPDWSASTANGFIANNDESAINAHLFLNAYICTGTYQSGQCGQLIPGGYGNTAPTFANNSESHYWN